MTSLSTCRDIRRPLLAAATALFIAGEARAQAPVDDTLLADINLAPAMGILSSSPTTLGRVGDSLFFAAETPQFGREVWSTDGNAGGTQLEFDITPGVAGSDPVAAIQLDADRFLFTAVTAAEGRELYIVDPANPNGALLLDIFPGPDSSGTSSFVAWEGRWWFTADDGTHGRELWSTDGTTIGTQLEDDWTLGSTSTYSATDQLAVAGGRLFAASRVIDTSLLAKDDATTPIAKLGVFAAAPDFTQLEQMVEVNGLLALTASTPSKGLELWISDGTTPGTVPIVDINPGPADANPIFLANDSNQLWFTADDGALGVELYRTDGLGSGTRLVEDITPGPESSIFGEDALVAGGGLLFSATDFKGLEPWFSNGNAATTARLIDINPAEADSAPQDFVEVDGEIYFHADSAAFGRELWRTGLTVNTTLPVTDVYFGSGDSDVRVLGGLAAGVLLSAYTPQTGYEPWLLQSLSKVTTLVSNLAPDPLSMGSDPRGELEFKGRRVFRATPTSGPPELWISAGHGFDTTPLFPQPNSLGFLDVEPLLALESFLLFSARTVDEGVELWSSDGTESGTILLGDFAPGPKDSEFSPFVEWNGLAYFAAGDPVSGEVRFWSTNGTVLGTTLLEDFGSVTTPAGAIEFTPYNDALFFGFDDDDGTGTSDGAELWTSDGLSGGAAQLLDIELGPVGSDPQSLTVVGDTLFFTATDAINGRELWSCDGTVAGTDLLSDIFPGADSSSPEQLTAFGTLLGFTADDGMVGREPWVSDGTPAGTTLLADIRTGADSSEPNGLSAVLDRLYFWATDDSLETHPWTSDGTPLLTSMLSSAPTPSQYSFEDGFTPIGNAGFVLFSANDLNLGAELWITGGTSFSTRVLADSADDLLSSNAHSPAIIEDRLVFFADDGEVGTEVHSLPFFATGTWLMETFGVGCGATFTFAGEGTIGEAVQLSVEASNPLETAFLYVSVNPNFANVGGGCTAYIGAALPLGSTMTDAMNQATLPVVIPNSPVIIGIDFYLQYLVTAPTGPLNGGFEVSDGLKVLVGP